MTPKPNLMLASDRFKLGIFSANCSGGMSITKVPERWEATWDDNLKLAQMADEAGLDFLLPVARWIGFPGEELTFMKSVLETTTWADKVFIAGVEQPKDSRQTQLRDRYAAPDNGMPPAYR